MKALAKKLLEGKNLTGAEAEGLMDSLIDDALSPEQIGFLLASFEFKGPTGEELAGFVRALLRKSQSVGFLEENLVDVCGTGGDGLSMFNVSTCVSFVVAAAGVKVAKHGNRAVSSRCGSFDVLEELGIPVSTSPFEAQTAMNKFGVAYLSAPSFHPILGVLAPIRRNLGVRTVLNALGPLLNPARVKRQLVGVYSRKLLLPMAEALRLMGAEEVMVVHGADGSDEISLISTTFVAHLKNGVIAEYEIDPLSLGFSVSPLASLQGGEARENAELIREVLAGKKSAHREITVLNAGAALVLGGKAADLAEGIELAAQTIDQGLALTRLLKQQRTPPLKMIV